MVSASARSAIVRESDETVRRWLKRYQAEGLPGLTDTHRRREYAELLQGNANK